jgi:tetratricopeptide (TPR) repeat protein
VAEIGDKRQIAYALVRLGHIADWRGDNAAAHDRSLESLALSRELGESGALAIFHLGIAAYKMGDFHAARRWFSERRAALPEDGWAHVGLGNAARGLGEYREARAHYREALRRFAPAGARLGMAFALELDSAAEIALGRHEGAARRIGACVAWRETAGMPPPASDATLYRRLEEEMRAALGEEAYARLNAEGRAMTLEQAAAQALEEMPEAAEEMPEAAGGAEPPHVAPPRPSP